MITNNLPDLVLKEIYKQLPNQKERIKCSFVCKKWRMVYQMFSTEFSQDLLCLYTGFNPKSVKLNLTNKMIGDENCFKIIGLDFLKLELTRINFLNIKKLVIWINLNGHPDELFNTTRFNFLKENTENEVDVEKYRHLNSEILIDFYPIFNFEKQLNYFKNLEHLQLHNLFAIVEDDEIDLPKLKLLKMDDIQIRNKKFDLIKLKLNTPLLENLLLNHLSFRLDFISNPHLLKRIEMEGFLLDDIINSETFKKFINLELLYSRSFYEINDEIIENLPNLKFIYVSNKISEFENLINLESTLYGLESSNDYLIYKDQINYYPTEIDVKYESLLSNKILLNFFKENYLKIKSLKIGHIYNIEDLVNFLKAIGHLHDLTLLSDFNLGQNFFNELPNYLSLVYLTIRSKSFYYLTNYEFLQKFNVYNITFLFFYSYLPDQLILNVFKNKICKNFYFELEDCPIKRKLKNQLAKLYSKKNKPVIDHMINHNIVRNIEINYFCFSCFHENGFFFKFDTSEQIKNHLETEYRLKHLRRYSI